MILRQLGWLKKSRLSFIQYGFDNPTTKGGGIFFVTYEQLENLQISDPSKSILEKYKLDLRPPSMSGKKTRFKRDSPGCDCYWMGGYIQHIQRIFRPNFET